MFKRNDKKIFLNSLIHNFANNKRFFTPVFCNKVNLDFNGNIYFCDKAFSIPLNKRDEFIIGSAIKGINNNLRLSLLEEKRREFKKITKNKCNGCPLLRYCFCPIGTYIIFSNTNRNFKDYFPIFCRLSQMYIKNFNKIIHYLRNERLFRNYYVQ